jgi:hypothetical protein
MVIMADPYGIEVERRRREFTAYHAVPDFVFRPVDVPKGGAQREVGDFLLWVGNAVAIVSHKARLPSAADRETDQRRRLWLDARVNEAYGQIKGVANNLRSLPPGALVLESERGVRVAWDAARIDGYVGIVLLDALEPEQQYAPPVITLRHNSKLHHIGLGRRHAGTRVLVLAHDLHVRVLDETGALIRELTLDPNRNYQRQAKS